MIYTVFFDNGNGAEMPQDFCSFKEAEEYAKERIKEGYANTYEIESTEGEIV